MVILQPASRLSLYGEDVYNHFLYNLHSLEILSGAIKAVIVISPIVASLTELFTSVNTTPASVEAEVSSVTKVTAAVKTTPALVKPEVSSVVEVLC